MMQDPSYAPTPASGTILFGCSSRSGWPPTSLSCPGGCPRAFPAFNVTQTANYTAVFRLSQYYTGLFVASTNGCSPPTSSGSPQQLSSGTKIQLSGSGSSAGLYDYCATYAVTSTGTALSGFTISWRSGSTVFSQTFPSVMVPPQPPQPPQAPPTAMSVVRGSDSNLYYATFAGSWSGWHAVGGTSTSGAPVLCSGGSESLYLAARGSDNVSISIKSYSNGSWSDLPGPGGSTNAQPACASMNGTLHLLARGVTGPLYYNSLNESSHVWSGWQGLGGSLYSPPVVAASPSLNRLDVVLEGASGTIWHMAFTNKAWSGQYDSPQGSTIDTPAITSDGRTLHLVVRGVFGEIYYNALNFTSNQWSSWLDLSGTTTVTPSLATDSSGTVHLLVVGTDGTIYHKSQPRGGVWSSSWDSPSGTTIGPIAVTAQGSSILIMVISTTGAIFYNVLTASTWLGWTLLGGSTALEPALTSIS